MVGKAHYIPMEDEENRGLASLVLEDEFPQMQKCVYANHAAISPWPRRSYEAVCAFALENMNDGPAKYSTWLNLDAELRQRIARMLGAESGDDIALTPNTTEGINIVANGLNWCAGDNLVTARDEFLSNRMAWEELENIGVEVRKVDIRASEHPETDLLSRVDGRTRLLSISSVQFTDGLRLNLEKLGGGCNAQNILFFVDAIQQFGAMPIDVQAAKIDFLSAGSHKWQMGPEGMGLFYCKPEIRTQLRLKQFGWRMLDKPYRFDLEDRDPSASARRFEPGSPNTTGQFALNASLGLLEEAGQANIAGRVLANTDQLINGLETINATEVVSSTSLSRRSGIVSFLPADKKPFSVCADLKNSSVVCSARGPWVRVSPHFYQGEAEIGRILNAVESAVNR